MRAQEGAGGARWCWSAPEGVQDGAGGTEGYSRV